MTLPWILLFLPLVVAAANQLALRKTGLAPLVSTASAVATFIIALVLLKQTGTTAFPWATIGDFSVEIGIKLDKLSTGMMIVVTGIGMLVHIFSLAYMKEDEAKARYFTGLSLFMFSMTGIVLANNFIMTFIFWELVGLSSYLLIGHWYQKDSAADAAKKAFLANRVGDFGFMIGILMLWGITGALSFDAMAEGVKTFQGANPAIFAGVLSTALLCVFCGAVGKSAQLPLHVWLPDAMEGPTPVSALIHAATMVAAGVYMLFRVQLSLDLDHEVLAGLFSSQVIAWVGGITSLAAALMATQQDDIKKILAYSTLSQLGYMVMAVGLVSGEAGMFHLFTHAWFKALLFLGSGAIIYACHHEQDIWKMGGLLKKMPITGITFAIGTAALIAVPFVTSGFYSKEEILGAAYHGNKALFGIAVFVAFLTTFYMTRAYVVTFLGKPRDEHGAGHAHEVGPLMFVPLLILAGMAIGSAFLTAPLNAIDPRHGGHEHAEGHYIILGASIASLVLGLAAGFVLYNGKDKDPVSIPLFKNRFYIDGIYDNFIVRYFQDAFAAIIAFFDELLINGLLVGGLSRAAESTGNIFRKVQSGSLQGYAFAFGLGVILVVYFTAF
ncbi:NADH-quinone oxidoreductase subunit L [Luteolibacter yonseiensis]|uniref:NADH-quinone oxidoreductase subunit L n=1 Tax=Luteolibacter yonseiensis TaxID=1144680 RepID=A0A934R8L6_9BACT|nr:NADH-quinone oxidoreductase subunit L [Luteolibacter yonseiensis]MBK1817918.1 NADH-quinone oxidoreductase subunit L [Luteolibacter yonseiensis]